jgi:hypothetical protein
VIEEESFMNSCHLAGFLGAAASALTLLGCAQTLVPDASGGSASTSSTTSTTSAGMGGSLASSTTGFTTSGSTASSTVASSTAATTGASSTAATTTAASSTSSTTTSSSSSAGGPVSCTMSYCNIGLGGYGFAYSDSQNVAPAKPGPSTATLATGTALCISGSVGQITGSPLDYTDDWGCGLGLNLDQAMGMNTPEHGYAFTGTGITVSTSAVPACTTARVIVDQNGASPDYCAPLTPGVEIPWASFNTACWDGTGTSLSGPPTSQSLKVQFVASATAACAYTDFCLNQVSF